jgi:hypothetical protein
MEFEEGDDCPYCDYGKMEYPRVENCSCHINPPCSACTSNKLECTDCGFTEEDEVPKTKVHSVTPVNISKKCECGAEKCGSTFHSSWCPKYNK